MFLFLAGQRDVVPAERREPGLSKITALLLYCTYSYGPLRATAALRNLRYCRYEVVLANPVRTSNPSPNGDNDLTGGYYYPPYCTTVPARAAGVVIISYN